MIGEPMDKKGPIFPNKETEKFAPLHSGIKVVDLIALYTKGGKISLFSRAGVRKMVIIMELINNIAMNHRSYFVFARVEERPRDLTFTKRRSNK
eukprot:11085925-Ditylum_brightwellii.AAC.1